MRTTVLPIATASLLLLAAVPAPAAPGGCDACERAARALRTAARHDAQDDYWVGVARCLNVTDPMAAAECQDEVDEERAEALELLAAQYDARLELCEALGGCAYEPAIDPSAFVPVVDNPWFPQLPGTTRAFESLTAEGLGRVEETVLSETREILGVPCTIVEVVESLDGDVIERTEDYLAQDVQGRVWYFGELARNYEAGYLVDVEGSWIGGVDGAQPGILMQAAPAPGQVYRQEFLATEAEDAAGVVGFGRTVTVPAGTFTDCLETFELSPLEPDLLEAKLYAPGVGLVLVIDLETGEREELVP